jgi:hypothetical protein
MSDLRKLLTLSAPERWLLIRAWLLLGMIRLGLWLLPFRTVQALLSRKVVRSFRSDRAARCSMEQIGWAVAVASVYVPFASCLSQALTAEVLLRRRGYAAVVRIGVAHTPERRLEAHAWVECAGQIVIGGSAETLAQYTLLPSFPLERHHVGQ